jgi:rhodanese-related sulfurtransferase
MDSEAEILARAKERASAMKLPYAGALLPSEAYALLQRSPAAMLIDVRTRAEWDFVGHVPDSTLIEWNTYPEGQRNTDFVEELKARATRVDAPVMFLCRSGARSHHAAAAAAQAGYTKAFNILQGFEGDKDAHEHRNSVGGWRVADLPWIQG